MNVVEAAGLGKRYGKRWAVADLNVTIPAGRIVALVGPNGAGKSTLLNMIAGLALPTEGELTVCGGLRAGSPEALHRVAFVAQDAPLYGDLRVREMVKLTGCLNRRWDQAYAVARLERARIAPRSRVAKLSGGQQAQLALTLALARRPELLVLDEPLARLDPLARHDVLGALLAAVSEDGISVIFSSHVLPELERIADYLMVIADGRVRIAGDTEELLEQHRALVGPAEELDELAARHDVIRARRAERTSQAVVRFDYGNAYAPPGWQSREIGMEDLVLAYMRPADDEPGAAAGAGLWSIEGAR